MHETMIVRSFKWLTHLASVALEEAGPLLSRRLLTQGAATLPRQSFSRTRTALLRAAGVKIGQHSLIQGAIHITGSQANPCAYLTIGAHTIITGPLHIDLAAPVRIGDGVRIGHDVTLLTITHAIGAENLRAGLSEGGDIEIGNGAWLASRVTVLPKIRIGAGSVVAAGSVVSRDVPPNTLVAGVPARVIRHLDTSDSPH